MIRSMTAYAQTETSNALGSISCEMRSVHHRSHENSLRLPADQRAVLLLVAMEDMSYEDTARILGIPAGTVMSRLSRARQALRQLSDGDITRPSLRILK